MWATDNIKEFCNTPAEWHSLIVGFFHSFYRHRKPPEKYMEEVISKEYHYYVTGRGIGQLTKITAIAVIIAVILKRSK